MKTGIVFEGGAFRTIFSCGVMDAFLDRDIMPVQPTVFPTLPDKKEEIYRFF